MMKLKTLSLSTLLLLAVMLVLLSACRSPAELPGYNQDSMGDYLHDPSVPALETTPYTDFTARVQELNAINQDAIGWLFVPNTSLDDVVMWYAGYTDIFFYLRRDFYGEYLWEGSYFVDFRTQWGDFTRESISRNIVIYGHSMEDDPDGPQFSQFKRWKDEEWARNNPYIFFSTLEENMVWEIFSVHFSNIWVPYNTPNPDDEEFQVLLDDAKARSLFNYDVDVTIDDTIITLSTCVYSIPTPGGGMIPLSYPNNYRFVVMARLVEQGRELNTSVSLTVNPNPRDARARP